jgi:Protein of unknown function (DUF1569)
MKSLFNPADSNELIQRVNSLQPQSAALWGKMNVAQMIAHLQQPLKVAFGELALKRGLIGFLFGKMMKKKFLTQGFGKNLPTSPAFIIKDHPGLEEEKKKLVTLLERFLQAGPDGISKKPHPFFGPLTPQEWDIIQYKHIDHHLNQFGV